MYRKALVQEGHVVQGEFVDLKIPFVHICALVRIAHRKPAAYSAVCPFVGW